MSSFFFYNCDDISLGNNKEFLTLVLYFCRTEFSKDNCSTNNNCHWDTKTKKCISITKKKLNELRQKNISYQKKRRTASNEWLKKKNEARSKLLTTLNPILQKYMNENNIQIIVDKKNILLANSKFDLTDIILKLLDKELKSIQLN